jgi:hypothetical protein
MELLQQCHQMLEMQRRSSANVQCRTAIHFAHAQMAGSAVPHAPCLRVPPLVKPLKLLQLHDVLQDTQTSSSVPQSTPTWGNFKKALGISVGTAVGAAVVAMYINNFSNTSCIVTGTCSQINDVMKGVCSFKTSLRCRHHAPLLRQHSVANAFVMWCVAHFQLHVHATP